MTAVGTSADAVGQALAPNPELAVETAALVKRFGTRTALAGIDLRVGRGGVHAVLGPNGAGKTTMIRVLATLLGPTGGSARVLGLDVVRDADEVRRRVALTGQFASVDDGLTGRENLVMIARLLGRRGRDARTRAAELLDAFRLADIADRQVRTYSGGLRRRLDLAASVVVRPELLFLDEPTTGLDPRSRNEVWDTVRGLVADGSTVVLTTQYLEEADRLADQVTVIDHGRVIAEGTVDELKRSAGAGRLELRPTAAADGVRIARLLEGEAHPARVDDATGAVVVPIADPDLAARALARVTGAAVELESFALTRPTLDEVFLHLTGRTTDDAAPQDGDGS